MIHTITFNPAIDKILDIHAFQLNGVNRIKSVRTCLGGKGAHVAYGLSLLGVENQTYGISFGGIGRQVIETLEAAGVRVVYDHYDTPESRMNYLLIDAQKNCTFLTEAGVSLTEERTDHLLSRVEEMTALGDVLAIAGDASNAQDPHIHQKLLDLAKRRGLKLYLDSSGEFLRKGVAYRPYLIKPNLEELSELTRTQITTQDEVLRALATLPEIPRVMVSMGAEGWVFRGEGKIYRGHGLTVSAQNTAGCGDSLLSALLYCFEHTDQTLLDALAFATAISATCAMSDLTVGFDVERAKRMQSEVLIEEVR